MRSKVFQSGDKPNQREWFPVLVKFAMMIGWTVIGLEVVFGHYPSQPSSYSNHSKLQYNYYAGEPYYKQYKQDDLQLKEMVEEEKFENFHGIDDDDDDDRHFGPIFDKLVSSGKAKNIINYDGLQVKRKENQHSQRKLMKQKQTNPTLYHNGHSYPALEKETQTYSSGYDSDIEPIETKCNCYCPCMEAMYAHRGYPTTLVNHKGLNKENKEYLSLSPSASSYETANRHRTASGENVYCNFGVTDCHFKNDQYQHHHRRSLFRYGYNKHFHAKLWHIVTDESTLTSLEYGAIGSEGWGQLITPSYLLPHQHHHGGEACVLVEFVFESEGTDRLLVSAQDDNGIHNIMDYTHERPHELDNLLLRKYVHFAIKGKQVRFWIRFEFRSHHRKNHYGLRTFNLYFSKCPEGPNDDDYHQYQS